MFKKICLCLFILILSCPLFGQQGIRYASNFIDFNFNIDSTTCNRYTKTSITFDEGSPGEWFTGGYYTAYVYIDTVDRAVHSKTIKLGDTDSLFCYVKEKAPFLTGPIYNDSTFITPTYSTTGIDWTERKCYKFDFELSPAKGMELYWKRNSDQGGINIRCVLTK
jgi:hypothetical protein